MSAKNIGTIRTASHKSVGKLYRPSSLERPSTPPHSPTGTLRQSRKSSQQSSNRKRTSSVGKIYSTHHSQRQHEVAPKQAYRRDFHQLINYDAMQEKLSNYLTCAIRTNNRQKYNYLSQHYTNQPQHYSKLAYCQNDIRPRTSILELAQNTNKNIMEQRISGSSHGFTMEKLATGSIRTKKEEPLGKKVRNEKLQSNKENIQWPDKGDNVISKKQGKLVMLGANHQQKSELSGKLMKIIDSYENKNKELSFEMKKLEQKFTAGKTASTEQQGAGKLKKNEQVEVEVVEDNNCDQLLTELLNQLVEYNLKSNSLSSECDSKLEELWKSIHQQILLDEKLRLIKAFINQTNLQPVLDLINANRIKKIDANSLAKHTDEYDPFLIEQLQGLLKDKNAQLTSKSSLRWIASNFTKAYEDSQRHWLKYLSQEKMECSIRSMILEREITGLRQNEAAAKQLSLRDFTRWLSILYKANLRNRNVYQIYFKVKDMAYLGRFIELLQEKAGKGGDLRKLTPSK